MNMEIVLNSKKELVEEGITIKKLLDIKSIPYQLVTVELNDVIVNRDSYDTVTLHPHDTLEFVYFMGGGQNLKKCGTEIAHSMLELIGNTPMVKLNRLPQPGSAQILAKLESYNPGGSIKDRICLSMIEEAEEKGFVKEGATIIEPTSGNTGIGIAMICAVKGYKCTLVMPESMSLERIYILRSYGAEIVLTPGIEGMSGSIKKAEELLKKTPNSFMPQQFKNSANPRAHKQTTAQEILAATQGKIDIFVAGVGTGGTISGVGAVLKEKNSMTKIIAVEPLTSAVLSGEKSGPHKIQGIGAGFIPDILARDVIDEIIKVSDNDAFRTVRALAAREGIFAGISAGAAAWAALQAAQKLGNDKTVVVILPDTGERYFSIEQYFEA